MRFMSITKRWFMNVASIVIMILVIVATILLISVSRYYYGVVDMALDAYSVQNVSTTLSLYGNTSSSSGFLTAGRKFIENFPDEDIMAVWLIDSNGSVVLSTTGFEIKGDVEMPDYYAALDDSSGTAKWTGALPSGERIKAMTCIYNYPDGTHGGALRFMISLEAVNMQLVRIAVLTAVVALVLFAILLLSSSLFIRSILNPIKDVGETAKKIAGGDLKARIDHYPYNDEIGELCTTINDMAAKLSVTDSMKNDFISTVSHELRTPLTAIKGWGETLLHIGDTDPIMNERGMKVIISEASRLNEMVEELLDFSRMSNGAMKLNIEKIDILAELDEVVFAFKERAIKEGIEIVYNVPSLPAPAMGDAARIKQVFINVLDNALKYSEQGKKISVVAEIKEPTLLLVSVSDNGPGIRAEDLPHVKEKFYKANSTVRGSGIGLAVADEIIRLHNGELTVDSIFGEGTTVTLTMPIEAVEYNQHFETEGANDANE
ncbi:MAG: HAMP domain-containing histidine kinase [Clostridia bacterium]|nr:HAMP domain-containing histidine kinase [Clostridia bacterium]